MKRQLFCSHKVSRRLYESETVGIKKRVFDFLVDYLCQEFMQYAVENRLIEFTEQFEAEFWEDVVTFRAKLNLDVGFADHNAFFNWARKEHPEYLFEFLMIGEDKNCH